MKYRAEIDGLRTLAVVPVLLYHLKISYGDGYFFPGGFLGVDIFFVISGFLITKILCGEMDRTGTVSISQFYLRRARRILPPLLLVLMVSGIGALLILTPTELSRFLSSAIASLLFLSNAYWFYELGEYGAQQGSLQPLLHTWSLAIEEQFYLVFPLLLILLKPNKRARLALIVIIVLLFGSLFASEITTRFVSKSFSFFSPLSRAWELLFGSALALAARYKPKATQWRPAWGNLVPKVAILVLLGYMAFFELRAWSHPGVATLPVVLATGAILWFARRGEAITTLLSSSPLVMIGKLSYSIYLWHFPIFAFGRYLSPGHPTAVELIVWTILTFALSFAGYYFVERPFRFSLSPKKVLGSLGAASAFIFAAFVANTPMGLLKPVDFANHEELYGGPYYDNEKLGLDSWAILDKLAGSERIDNWNARQPSENEKNNLWFENPNSLKILIVGNSHAKDLFNALYQAGWDSKEVEFARFGIATEYPDAQLEALYEATNFAASDAILIAPRYGDDLANTIPPVIRKLRNRGKVVAIVGNTPEFTSPGRLPIYDYTIRRQRSRERLSGINTLAFQSRDMAVTQKNEQLRSIAREEGAIYLSRTDLVCSQQEATCSLVDPEGRKTMYDNSHWTLGGALLFGRRADQQGWLEPVIEETCSQTGKPVCGDQ